MQLSHISIFAFHLLLHQTNLVSSSQCIRKVFQECKGYRATNNLIYSTEKADFDGCQRACLLEATCNGFNIIWQTDNPKPRECQLLRLSIPLKDFTEDDTTSFFYNCPSDMKVWTYRKHIACYKVEDSRRLQWDDAMEYCRRYHPQSHLFDIQTADEKEAVRRNINRLDKFWTAGKVTESGNVWTTTGEVVNSSLVNWNRGEPDQYTESITRAISVNFLTSTGWSTSPATQRHIFICEL